MSLEKLPPPGPNGDHDSIDMSEVGKLRDNITVQLEANYAGACAVLRANVYAKLMECSALENGKGWAVFYLTDENLGNGAVQSFGEHTEVLVAADRLPNYYAGVEGYEPRFISEFSEDASEIMFSYVRLVSNEAIIGEDQLVSWITEDFSLWPRGSARYFMSAWLQGMKIPHTAPIFYGANTGRVQMPSYEITDKTPLIDVYDAEDKVPSDIRVKPFGCGSCLEDKLYALGKGALLLNRIAAKEPVYTGTN